MFARSICSLLVLGLLVAPTEPVRAQLTTATLYGIVTDPTGGAIPGANFILVHEGIGSTTTKLTDADGEVAFDFLRVGLYRLEIEAKGFKKYQSSGIELAAAQSVRRTFVLQLGSLTETINVEGTAQLVDVVTTEQRESQSRLVVTQLPLARRNYSSLLSVGTGVTYTTDSGNGVRLNGLGKMGTNITVDGTDASSNPEGRNTSMYQSFNYIDTLSIEAIQEVQTIKGVIAAEYGQALSGNVNLITRSGTNEWHGSLFENFQAEDLNARNQFLSRKPSLTFNQFGGSVGGPIKRDRVFIFGTYEGYRERAFRQVDGNTPTPKLRDEMIRAVPGYKKALDTLPLPNQPYAPDADVGFFLGAGATKAGENQAVLKSDIRLTNSSNLSLTYTRGRPFRLVPSFQLNNDRDWKGWQERGTMSFVVGGSAWSSETRFGYNLNDMDRLDAFFVGGLDPAHPETTFGGRRTGAISALGFGTAGTEFWNMGGPTWTLEQKYALHVERHSLKFGAKYSSHGGGRFDVENSSLRYENKADLLANIPSRVQLTYGTNPYNAKSHELGFFAQDDWRVSPRLVINLGARYDFFSKLVARPTTKEPAGLFNLDGLRDSRFTFGPLRDPGNPFNSDGWANIGPRLGFSYNPDGKGINVIRGGFSMMFSPLMTGIFRNAVATKTVPFRVIYGKTEAAALGLRFPVFNDDVRPIVESAGQLQVSAVFNPDIQAPYSMNVYLGTQRALTSSTMFETAFVANRGVKFLMYRRFNTVDRFTGLRPNSTLGEGDYIDHSQNTVYYSWQTSFRKHYRRNLTASAHYTWGKALSYGGGDIGGYWQGDTSNSLVQNFFDLKSERGPSTGDVTHYFAADWVYNLPSFSAPSSAAGRNILGGWQISGILRAQTGQPINLSQPSGIFGSRPDYIGGAAVNSNYSSTLQYLNRAAFAPVPRSAISGATLRPGNIGNGALRGPGLWDVDLSFGKNFSITEQVKLQLRADMFTALNHTNLGGPVTNIESPLFGRITSARGARQIQLNMRLSF